MRIRKESIIYPLPTEEFIEDNERDWGIKLPEDYKEFLKKYNGCIPVEQYFSYWDQDQVITRFLCVLDDIGVEEGAYDINVVLAQIELRLGDDEEVIGADVLPIAELFAGDYLCLDYRSDPAHPCVTVWAHEESGEFDPVHYHIADSFVEFVKMLREDYPKEEKKIRRAALQYEGLKARQGETPPEMVWHHDWKPGNMQLVPTRDHNFTAHNGGRTPGMWSGRPLDTKGRYEWKEEGAVGRMELYIRGKKWRVADLPQQFADEG